MGKDLNPYTEILTIFFINLKIKDFNPVEKERNNPGEWKRTKE